MNPDAPTGPPPFDAVRDEAIDSEVLLDDAEIRVEYFRRGGPGGTLVVTFDPIAYAWDRPPFGHEFLRKQRFDVVAVRKKAENFYQPLSREALAAVLRPVAANYARVFSYGSSLGAYAALYYGRDEAWTVIASSPRNSTHPVFGADPWRQRVPFRHARLDAQVQPRCEAIILYDPRDAIDRRYLDNEVLPQFPDAKVLRVPFSGHPSNQALAEMGFLPPFVRAVLAGTPRDQWPRLRRRADRVRSAAYFQVLALHAIQRGHVAWADTLVARSLVLKPQAMLALRTQGLVRLAQGDGAAAQRVLEAALALLPDDPYTITLLERARAQCALQAPPGLPAAGPSPARPPALRRHARRLWARLASLFSASR